jgi:drug/metabolite transporter (DMT)-like permease
VETAQVIESSSASRSRQAQNLAAAALVLATLFWGTGFTWAKAGGATINHATSLGDGAALGPMLLLGVRFVFSGLLWLAIFPQARRGWSIRSVGRALAIGVLVAIGLILQHLGLDRTSQAVSAFLTSLTIVFVPVLSTLALRKPPGLNVWIAVAVATVGVFLLTVGAGGGSFGWGELLGLACAFDFSIYVFVVNALVPRDDPFRMSGGQFMVCGILTMLIVPFLSGGTDALRPHEFARIFALRDVWLNCLLLSIFPTLISYGLLTHFQPKLDATRATLIYLLEPVFAAVFAYLVAHSPMQRIQIVGAAMILIANALVEVLEARSRKSRIGDIAPREQV